MKQAKITVNIPVKDLERAINFYKQIGFKAHEIFKGPDCQCMIFTDDIHVMVHLDTSLKNFTPNPIADPSKVSGVVLCLDCGSKEEVDDLISKSVANGGATYGEPQDMGFVYTNGFLDPDGNAWRLNYMNPNASM